MEMPSYIVWTYLTLTAAVIIDGFPVPPNEYHQVSCWGWKGATIKLCSDESGRGFILTQDSRDSNGIPSSQGHVPTEFPGSQAESDVRRQLSNINLMPTLSGQNHHSRGQSSPNKNGKMPYIAKRRFDSITYNHDLAKRPFDSITYNHDLAGFK